MTGKEMKRKAEEYKRFLITTVNVLRVNSKITDKEYAKIRNRILEGKNVND